DGSRLAAGFLDAVIVVWDHVRNSGQSEGSGSLSVDSFTLTPKETRGRDVYSVAFDPEGTFLASGHLDGSVLLWDVQLRKMIREHVEPHGSPVESVVFTPDGRWLVSGSDDKTVSMWDVLNLKEPVGRKTGHLGPVQSVAISSDGRLLA